MTVEKKNTAAKLVTRIDWMKRMVRLLAPLAYSYPQAPRGPGCGRLSGSCHWLSGATPGNRRPFQMAKMAG